MSASARITAALSTALPAPTGTGNVSEQSLEANSALTAETDTIAQIAITPDNNITGDDQTIELQLMSALVSCVADDTADDITAAAHGLEDGQPVQFTAAVMPDPLVAGTTYYVRDKTTNDFKLAASVGGTAIDLTSAGTTVKFRTMGRVTVVPTYPSIGPAVPVVVRDSVNGDPNDFTRIRAIQVVLRPLDPTANASGTIHVTAGDTADDYAHFNLPLVLAYLAATDEQNWPSWLAPLPAGFVYDPANHLTVRIKDGVSNTNLLILLNLLGN